MSAAGEHTMRGEATSAPPHRGAPVAVGPHRDDAARARRAAVKAFFDQDGAYRWWRDVYAPSRPRGFFSHEMTRRRERVLDALTRHARVGPGARVLECGCGPGGQLRPAAESAWGAVGVDLDPLLLAEARAAVPRAAFACGDAEALPFRDGVFDAVLCVGVLSYLREDERAIRELARVVKPGGVVVVANPNALLAAKLLDPYYWLVWLPARVLGTLGLARGDAPRDADAFDAALIRRYRWRALDPVFARAGLATRETVSVSFGPLTLWRREVLPLAWSVAVSDGLAALASTRPLALLGALSNHWVTVLARDAASSKGGRRS